METARGDPDEEQPATKRRKLLKNARGWRKDMVQPDYEELVRVLSDYFLRHAFEEDNEVEIRLGQFSSRRFNPGISADSFHKIMDKLTSDLEWVERQDYVQQTDYLTKAGLRLRVIEEEGTSEIVNKRNSAIVDVKCDGAPFDFRVSFAKAKPVAYEEALATQIKSEATATRYKDRVSFIYKYFSWDLSVVSETKREDPDERTMRESFDERPGEDGSAVYEVELELKPLLGKELPKKSREMALVLAESMVLKTIDMMYFLEELDPALISFEVSAGKNMKKC